MDARVMTAAILGASALMTIGAPLAQSATPSFPHATDAESLAQWLLDDTNMLPDAVVSVGKTSIIGLAYTSPQSLGTGQFQVRLRSEVIDPVTSAEGGYLSWSADVDIDCVGRRSRATRIVNFSERNLRGSAHQGSESGEWVTPARGTRLYSVISAVCDADFVRPLAGLPRGAATATRTPSSAAPEAQVSSPPTGEPPADAPPKAPPSERPPTKPAPPKPPTAKTSPKWEGAAQIAASSSAEQARGSIAKVRRAFPQRTAGLSDSIEEARVAGRSVHRALLRGFASRAEAASLCAALSSRSLPCFLRSFR